MSIEQLADYVGITGVVIILVCYKGICAPAPYSGCDFMYRFPRVALRLPWATILLPTSWVLLLAQVCICINHFVGISGKNTLEEGNWIVAQGKRSAALGKI